MKMVIKIQINLTNKWLYSLIALGILLVFGVGVYAYNVNYVASPGNASVMGHTLDEIEGLEDYVTEIVERIMGEGDSECTNLVYSSVNLTSPTYGAASTPGYNTSIALPNNCMSSIDTCVILQEIYHKTYGLYRTRIYTFRQSASGKWWSSYRTTGEYTNGDSTYTDIVPNFGDSTILIRDDYTTEKTRQNITIRDATAYYGQRIFIC